MFSFALGFLLGLLAFIAYGAHRAVGSDGWDDSNVLNWLRLLSHCVMHPEDFGKMWYVNVDEGTGEVELVKRPFDYIDKDEFSEVVKSRP